jgi:hypothetical protein
MSSRVTRSSARLAGEPPSEPSPPISTRASTSTRKRKAPDHQASSPAQEGTASDLTPRSSARKIKRPKVDENLTATVPQARSTRRRVAVAEPEMSNTATSSKHTEDPNPNTGPGAAASTSKRKAGRSKKSLQGYIHVSSFIDRVLLTLQQKPHPLLTRLYADQRSGHRKRKLKLPAKTSTTRRRQSPSRKNENLPRVWTKVIVMMQRALGIWMTICLIHSERPCLALAGVLLWECRAPCVLSAG